MCSSTLSVNCEKGGESHATVPRLPIFIFTSGRRSLVHARLSKERVILKEGGETAGVCPLVRPRGVSADSARFASAHSR